MTDHLPERCFVVLPGVPTRQNVFVCVRGELGVQATRMDFGDYEAATRVVRELNDALGVGPIAVRAMLVGCLTGWNRVQREFGFECRPMGATVH